MHLQMTHYDVIFSVFEATNHHNQKTDPAIRGDSITTIFKMFRVAASSLAAKLPSRSVRNQRFLTKTSFLLPDPSEDKGFQLSKIVATIGPTSEQREPLLKVVDAGMKIMRLNFSHATTEEVELRTTNLALAQVSKEGRIHSIVRWYLLLHPLCEKKRTKKESNNGILSQIIL